MSVPPGCLLNLRRHYFATQHDCIHIIPHPAKVTGTPLDWWPCARGPWGAGFNQRDRVPSAFSFDGQSNKAGSSMTHQSARVRAGGERWWRRDENSRFRLQQRSTDLCSHTAAIAEVTSVELKHWSAARMTMGALLLSDHQSQIRGSILQRHGGPSGWGHGSCLTLQPWHVSILVISLDLVWIMFRIWCLHWTTSPRVTFQG